ncbi:protein of unknown function [Kyrpidia spormannii]|uniref:Uncharacterized protein n=1 Tax=Kyrpidia spormannii TaxID=2055160 RepID=A0A6F9EHK4_9BACL|nr:protein of unknown function [Kyrpidia spormannii]
MQPEPNPDEAKVEPMVNRVPCNGHDLEDWYLKYLKKPPAPSRERGRPSRIMSPFTWLFGTVNVYKLHCGVKLESLQRGATL